MRHNTPVTTLAAALALALALLLGVLLPSDGTVHAQVATQTNRPPEFAAETDTRSIEENTPPGVSIGVPVSATDDDEDTEEFGNTLTYSLGGTDAALFDIDPSTGQLITKAPLDAEATGGGSHTVTVTVDDGENPQTQTVTITVTDVNEPPAAPTAPTVVSGKTPTLVTIRKNRPPDCMWYGTHPRTRGTAASIMTWSIRRAPRLHLPMECKILATQPPISRAWRPTLPTM